jgi:hypothetical protein
LTDTTLSPNPSDHLLATAIGVRVSSSFCRELPSGKTSKPLINDGVAFSTIDRMIPSVDSFATKSEHNPLLVNFERLRVHYLDVTDCRVDCKANGGHNDI